MKLYDPDVIRYLKRKYKFRFSKSLGQNFLTDRSVLLAIVEGAGITKEDHVIEIGPGIGTLTREASAAAGAVTAVEIDEGLMTILRETLADCLNVTVVESDILKADLGALLRSKPGFAHVKIIGNLPYYITTPILMKLLKERSGIESVTVMMQKEVADRILSGPGTKAYGALTAAVQYYSVATRVVDVPRTSFLPPPKVDSTVVHLTMRGKPAVSPADEAMLFRVIRTAFGQRRKTLVNALGGMGVPKETVRNCLREAGIEETRRAETLSLEEFASLSDAFTAAGERE